MIIVFFIAVAYITRISYLLFSDFDSLSYEDQRNRTIILLKLRKWGIVIYK